MLAQLIPGSQRLKYQVAVTFILVIVSGCTRVIIGTSVKYVRITLWVMRSLGHRGLR